MLVGEQFRDGLASILTARCKGCGTEILFPTSSKVAGGQTDAGNVT